MEEKALPPGPKKPLNAFLFFSLDKRAEAKEANPEMGAGGISKVVGEMWQGLSMADKAPWMGKAVADKDRYATALLQYEKEHGALPPSATSKRTETPAQLVRH